MGDWIEVRRKARDCHFAALKVTNGDHRAENLLAAALKNAKLTKELYDPGTRYNEGVVGMLDRDSEIVFVESGQEAEDEAMVIGHEIGHFHLHTDPLHAITSPADTLGGDPVDGGVAKVEGYSPTERNEVQANIFADEFLCPSDWARREYIECNQRPSAIAVALGIPHRRVMNQVIRALLLPPLRDPIAIGVAPAIELDASQQRAATWKDGPLLVDAGPGTGKTRTLVHRVKHYFENGSSPASILALTFSNKAADEMLERISKMNPTAAVEMWISTFHSFGWEIIQKWPSAIGRNDKVELLDEAECLALLENNLEKLSLLHYQNLYEPAYELVPVLRAISRCKDELITPEEYRRHAEEALDAAGGDDEAVEKAAKSVEIAGIYEVYEKLLAEANAVDFGDLVLKPIIICEKNSGAKHYIRKFKHVLVDEYQDVNLASSRLLQTISKNGAVPWVVADQRQSIFRFRGAQPTNVSRFTGEFSGQRVPLEKNYRSFSPIVRTFENFSNAMGGHAAMSGRWEANRGDGGAATMTVAPDIAAEAEAIKQKAEQFRANGIPFSDQVILGRSHLTLSRITSNLERLGVPLLYLGDLFERAEIRDLLSLLAIGSEPGNIGLPRIAALPEYGVDRTDALTVMAWSDAASVSIFEALKRVSDIPEISEEGRAGLTMLGTHLDGLEQASPWTLATTWLLERSDYLRPLLVSEDVNARQKLIAIYHFLKVCSESARGGINGRREFLRRIRRIETLNQDTPFRAVSSEASDLEAIRVMTIHGSKGLEFGAVHFPAVAAGYLPSRSQWVRCPPPLSLPQLVMDTSDHGEEEEGLFFVGLSRAKDYLSLSRADKYTPSRTASASKFLDSVGSSVRHGHFRDSGSSVVPEVIYTPRATPPVYSEKQLSIYMECPARFQYEVLDNLRGARDQSPYIQFHRCVYVTVGWLESDRIAGRVHTVAEALAHLATVWPDQGPITHGFSSYYRRAAEGMVGAMCTSILGETGQYARAEWIIPLANGKVSITADRVLIEPSGLVRVQRTRTGKKTKSEIDKPIYALLRKGATEHHPGKQISVEAFYLATGDVISIPGAKDAKKLKEYDDAMANIARGDFNIPSTLPQNCPNCPAYFACGAR